MSGPMESSAGERSAYLLAEARARDPERYLAALFAPPERRDVVLALVLLNRELARVPDVVSQPMAGYIRYQWWRDALEELAAGRPPRAQPVVQALAQGLAKGWLATAPLQAMIDVREQELEQTVGRDLASLEEFARATGGALQEAILHALGGGSDGERRAAADIGTALSLIGVIHAVGHEVARHRQPLPNGLLAAAGVRPSELESGEASAGLRAATAAILDRAETMLDRANEQAGRPRRSRMAAFLPAVLARSHVRRIRALDADPFRAGEIGLPATAPLRLLAAYLRRRA